MAARNSRFLSCLGAIGLMLGGVVFVLTSPGTTRTAQAAVYWASTDSPQPSPLSLGVQSPTPTLCFVGNAVMTRRPRIEQIVHAILNFEAAANIRFKSLAGNSLTYELSPEGNVNNLRCPPSTPANGKDFFAGDIRVVIPGTDVDATIPVPGLGCANDILYSAPDCVSWGPDRIDCVDKGYDGAAYLKSLDKSGWTSWQSLGGTLTSGPSIASWGPDRLDIVARGLENGLWHQFWDGSWHSWSLIPGTAGHITSDPDCHAVPGSNSLQCAVGYDDVIHTLAFTSGSGWGSPVSWGFSLAPGSGPSYVTSSQGRMDFIYRTPDNSLRHSFFVFPDWMSVDLGGQETTIGDPDCVSWGENRIDCFVRGATNHLLHTTYNGSSWSLWNDLGGTLTTSPTVTSRSIGHLDVFAGGGNKAFSQVNWDGSRWNGWLDLGDNTGWGSWSNPPWTLNKPEMQACMYNLKLGEDPWCPVNGELYPCPSNPGSTPYLNHTLHEFGHALGLAHEHIRVDALPSTGCNAPGFGGNLKEGLLTSYDPDSVMNYYFSSCGISGNYADTGLSAGDKLALHVLYPNDDVAEFRGQTTIYTGQTLQLTSDWKAQGLNVNLVASNFQWRLDNTIHSTTPDLALRGLASGIHPWSLSYEDFLGRHYAFNGNITVLTPAQSTLQNNFLTVQTSLIP